MTTKEKEGGIIILIRLFLIILCFFLLNRCISRVEIPPKRNPIRTTSPQAPRDTKVIHRDSDWLLHDNDP